MAINVKSAPAGRRSISSFVREEASATSDSDDEDAASQDADSQGADSFD